MNIQEQAHQKLLIEMENNISSEIEKIHTWLCSNLDDTMSNNIINEDRTLLKCWDFVLKKVEEEYINKNGRKNGGYYVGERVYEFVREYYTLTEELLSKVFKTTDNNKNNKTAKSELVSKSIQKIKPKKKSQPDDQLTLF